MVFQQPISQLYCPFTISYSICFICNNKEKQETIPEMHLYLEGLVN